MSPTLNSHVTHALGMTGIALLATLGASALASRIAADEIEQFFVRYMANGMSNVEIQYRLSESDAYASGEHSDDRVHIDSMRYQSDDRDIE